jgi:precorrin-6B methylase 2|tara:strand:- start:692 stop:1402 length:711 start_codon:yes stop_codon:yes gene_type:complete
MSVNDPFGKACLAYLKGIHGLEIKVKSDHTEDDILPVDYLFRTYNEMSLLEQTALDLCKGKVLDIGAGAGCHSKWLMEHGFTFLAIDQSSGVIEALQYQNINAVQVDFFNLQEIQKYDTLLALMNGTGISGTEKKFPEFLNKCKKMLAKNGQLLIDSSDIMYLFDNDKKLKAHSKNKYYGQVKYQMVFDNDKSEWFDWIYFSYEKLKEICQQNGMSCEFIFEGDLHDYLVRIAMKD